MSDPRRETALSHLLINQGRSAKMSAVCEIGDFGYLNIRVRPTDTQGQKKLEEISGLTVPAAPNTYSSAGRGTETRRLLWLGPDEFLCLLPHATLTSAVASLEASAESAMGITDVSSGYTLLTLTSPFANEIVRSACPYDVARLTANRCAQTLFGKAQVLTFKEEANIFYFLVRRSFAGYCHHRLVDAIRQWEK